MRVDQEGDNVVVYRRQVIGNGTKLRRHEDGPIFALDVAHMTQSYKPKYNPRLPRGPILTQTATINAMTVTLMVMVTTVVGRAKAILQHPVVGRGDRGVPVSNLSLY